MLSDYCSISATKRIVHRSGSNGKVRFYPAKKSIADGFVPAVLYGKNLSNGCMHVVLDNAEIAKIYNMEKFVSHIFRIHCDGYDDEGGLFLVKCMQYNAIQSCITHIDFQRVDNVESFRCAKEIVPINESQCPGITSGAHIRLDIHSIIIKCNIDNIPDFVYVDVSGIEAGGIARVKDLVVPEGVVICMRDKSQPVAHIVGKKKSVVVSVDAAA